jgi:H+/Cl- antiporter ClcA
MKSLHKIYRRLHHLELATFDAWRDRLVMWLAAATAGLAVVAFTALARLAADLCQWIYAQSPYFLLVLTPSMGMLVLALTRRFTPMAAGSGIPQVMVAMSPDLPRGLIGQFVSIRIAVTKILLGSLGLAAGYSLGREGPSVQIAASVMHGFRGLLSAKSRIKPSDLLLAGGAAGIAATFNAPLAGILFAIEELSRRFEERASGVIISSIVLAGVVAISIYGNMTYFGHINVTHPGLDDIVPIVCCVFIAGAFGGFFSKMLLSTALGPGTILRQWRQRRPYLFAGVCGLLVACIGVFGSPSLLGTGYGYTQGLIAGTETTSWMGTAGKLVATLLSYWSGIPGGLFAPSLAIGAGIGNDVGTLMFIPSQILIAVGMVAFLAAVTQAPLTAFVIVIEMTSSHDLILVLMVSALIANVISKLITTPLYKTLADAQIASLCNNEIVKQTSTNAIGRP